MPSTSPFGAFVGWGRETVLGTTVARSIWNTLVSESVKLAQPYVFPPELRSPTAPRGTQVGLRVSKGTIRFNGIYQGLESFFKDAFGTVTDTILGSTAKQHAFALATALPSPGLSIEINRVQAAMLYADCKVDSLAITWKPNDEVLIDVEIIGREETIVSASTPTYPTVQAISGPQVSTLTVDGAAIDLDDLTVKIDNKLVSIPKLGSLIGREPLRNAPREITGSFTKDFEGAGAGTPYDKFRTGAGAALICTAQGATAAGADKYTLTVNCPTIIFTGETPVVAGPGILKQKVSFRAVQNAAPNDEMTANMINMLTTTV